MKQEIANTLSSHWIVVSVDPVARRYMILEFTQNPRLAEVFKNEYQEHEKEKALYYCIGPKKSLIVDFDKLSDPAPDPAGQDQAEGGRQNDKENQIS